MTPFRRNPWKKTMNNYKTQENPPIRKQQQQINT